MKEKNIAFLLVLFLCLSVFASNSNAQKRKNATRKNIVGQAPKVIISVEKSLSPELQRRVDAFNFVWHTLRDNYFDQTFSGLDWNKIKKEYEPRVLKTASDNQLHDILQEMINRLNRSHFTIIPPEVYETIEKAKTQAKAKEKEQAAMIGDEAIDEETAVEDEPDSENYLLKFGIGIDLRLLDNRFVVTRVEKDSTAETAGLKTGYVIEKINGVSLVELLQKLEVYYAKVRNIRRYLPAQVVDFMLKGEKESFVTLTCLTESDETQEIKVQREILKGETIFIGQNFPDQFLKFESATLDEQVGYIKFNLFALPIIEKFCAALNELKDKKAIIIDLRGNTGGILGTLAGLGGMLTEKSLDLGTSIYKVGSENMIAASKAKNFKGRLVFLVDNQTVSAAEIFSAALQENNRALVIGEKTAGEALPSVLLKLPTGAVLLYPIANFKTRNGNFLEGKGVEPNLVVALDRKSLLTGKDAQLETALRVIKEDKDFPSASEAVLTIKGAGTSSPPPPPPPVAMAKPKSPPLKKLAEVTIKSPSPAAPPAPAVNRKDERAMRVIAEFLAKIGGQEAWNKINSYSLKGNSELVAKGTKVDLEIKVFRQKADKYAEIMKSISGGDIRQVYNGKKSFVQNDFGFVQELQIEVNTSEIEIFAPINSLFKKDDFKSLIYVGTFERLGKKAHIIEGKTAENLALSLAFDVETQLLAGYTLQYFTVSFNDYRKVENLLLPFHITRVDFMDIKLDEIKLNQAIEESNFMKKENCFDKAN